MKIKMNYGIKFCQKVLNTLREKEDEMFEKTGSGFAWRGQDHLSEIEHKSLLRKFKKEKELGLQPSYSPSIHGE
jgi:hypothetical protein